MIAIYVLEYPSAVSDPNNRDIPHPLSLSMQLVDSSFVNVESMSAQEEINYSDVYVLPSSCSDNISNYLRTNNSHTNIKENNFMYCHAINNIKHHSENLFYLSGKCINDFISIDFNMCIWLILFEIIGIFSYCIFDYVIQIIHNMLRIVKLILNNKILLYITIILLSLTNIRIVSCSQYSQLSKILAKDGASNDFFGSSLSIYDNNALTGTYDDDDKGANSGNTYIYNIYHLLITILHYYIFVQVRYIIIL
jgi:hypothetical protein